jgi:hypothetical protein
MNIYINIDTNNLIRSYLTEVQYNDELVEIRERDYPYTVSVVDISEADGLLETPHYYIDNQVVILATDQDKQDKIDLLMTYYSAAQQVNIVVNGSIVGSYSLMGKDWDNFQIKAGGKPISSGNIFSFGGYKFTFTDIEMIDLLQSLDQPYSVHNFIAKEEISKSINNAITQSEIDAIVVDGNTFNVPPAQDLTSNIII